MKWIIILVMLNGIEMEIEASPELCLAIETQDNLGHVLMPDGSMEFPVRGYCVPPDPCGCVESEEASS